MGFPSEVKWRENQITDRPELKSLESTQSKITLYVNMQRGKFALPNTGIFIPDGFTAQAKVNLILYLHGYALRVTEGATSIKEFWGGNAGAVFPLREGLNDSKKQYILVAPSVGATDGLLNDLAANIDFFFSQVMAALYVWGPLVGLSDWGTGKVPPELGEVILAGHSGAGAGMMKIAGGISDHVTEVWGFDTLHYTGVDDQWANFALAKTKTKVYLYYATYKDRSLAMQRKTTCTDNVFIMEGAEVTTVATKDGSTELKVIKGVGHDYLLQQFWLERLNNIGQPSQMDAKRHEATRSKAAKS